MEYRSGDEEISKGLGAGRSGGRTNDFKKRNYGGPCPPSRAPRYSFKLYALDTVLNLDPRSGKADLEKAMKAHILAQAQLMTAYKKKDEGIDERTDYPL